VINDILDYSKYESGQLELEAIPFSLPNLAKECGALLDTVIRNNRIAFAIHQDPSFPELLVGDPARIRQVLLNLLNNAFKFGKDGPVRLSLLLESASSSEAKIRVEVTDKG